MKRKTIYKQIFVRNFNQKSACLLRKRFFLCFLLKNYQWNFECSLLSILRTFENPLSDWQMLTIGYWKMIIDLIRVFPGDLDSLFAQLHKMQSIRKMHKRRIFFFSLGFKTFDSLRFIRPYLFTKYL